MGGPVCPCRGRGNGFFSPLRLGEGVPADLSGGFRFDQLPTGYGLRAVWGGGHALVFSRRGAGRPPQPAQASGACSGCHVWRRPAARIHPLAQQLETAVRLLGVHHGGPFLGRADAGDARVGRVDQARCSFWIARWRQGVAHGGNSRGVGRALCQPHSRRGGLRHLGTTVCRIPPDHCRDSGHDRPRRGAGVVFPAAAVRFPASRALRL